MGEQLDLPNVPTDTALKDGSAPFRVIVADPPWRFGDKLPGEGRGAEKHYPTLTPSEIVRFPLPPIADNAVLFLWRVASMQQEALDTMRWWGFRQTSEGIWLKRTPKGRRHFGMGRIVRMEHEVCLIGKRGVPPAPKDLGVRSVIDPEDVTDDLDENFSFVLNAVAPRTHSKKPEEFFDVVERLYDGPYLELFARRVRPGWTCMGDEI